MSVEPPKMKALLVYDYHELEKYLLETKAVTQEDVDVFWHWWCDHGEIGNNRLSYVPIGYWGWNDGPPETMKTPAECAAEEGKGAVVKPKEDAVYRVLQALLPFANDQKDLRVITSW